MWIPHQTALQKSASVDGATNMAADLTNPFGPSCCDGGECNIGHQSALTCGCDPGCNNYLCARHRAEKEADERIREAQERRNRQDLELQR